jgi:mono/diheme cytochrome c family protein
VSIGLSPKSTLRARMVGPVVCVGLLLIAGCNANYPESLKYPLRTDVLVLERPQTTTPKQFDSPGQLTEWLNGLKAMGAKTVNPADMDPTQRGQLDAALNDIFGTPAHPRVKDLAEEVTDALQLEPDKLAEGSNLYRRHCVHCHGVPGNGEGPTAAWVNPHPRDYRRGIFKFTSSSQPSGKRKPRREDLVRTVRQGIEGTSMPAFGSMTNDKFGVLHDEQLNRLVSYVIHLSMRGQTEFEIMSKLLPQKESDKGKKVDLEDSDGNTVSIADYAKEYVKLISGHWREANEDQYLIRPGPYQVKDDELKESVRRGYDLFTKPGDAGCVKCHFDFGRQNNFLFDDWGTIVRPADLTTGVYRGGRRPIDLYYRIHAGINGANMPAFGDTLKPDQVWDIINFLEALPYPKMREKYGLKLEAPAGHEEVTLSR